MNTILQLKQIKFILLFLTAFVIIPIAAYSQSNTDTEKQLPADTAKIGIYIFSIYDIDFPGNKIDVDFYLWYLFKNDSLKLNESFELVNSKEVVKSGETFEKKAGYNYVTFRGNSVIKKQWNVTNFPFDKQVIEMEIEDADFDVSKLILIADTLASKIDKDVRLEGYTIKDFGIRAADHTYETTYGDPTLKSTDYSTYSRVVVYFTLERNGKGVFFKLFLGLFISVLISLLTFFINPTDLDPRFGLSVGAIFAAIASQYVISSALPQNQTITLVDTLHDISFIFIFLCILISTVSLHFMKKGNEPASKKVDRYSFYSLSVLYTVLVLYFILRALK